MAPLQCQRLGEIHSAEKYNPNVEGHSLEWMDQGSIQKQTTEFGLCVLGGVQGGSLKSG